MARKRVRRNNRETGSIKDLQQTYSSSDFIKMNISRNVSKFKDAVGAKEKQQRTRCINNRATEKLIPIASE